MPLPYQVDDIYLQDNLDELDKRSTTPKRAAGSITLSMAASGAIPTSLTIHPGIGPLESFVAQAWPLSSFTGFQTAGAIVSGSDGVVAVWGPAQSVTVTWMAVGA